MLGTPLIPDSFELVKLLVENAFGVIAAGFAGIFMLIVSVFFFNGMRKINLKTLFVSEKDGDSVSSTKFWTSIAYFVATIAFLVINFHAPAGAAIEFIWAIYLTTLAGHSVLSKFLALRYGPGANMPTPESQQLESVTLEVKPEGSETPTVTVNQAFKS